MPTGTARIAATITINRLPTSALAIPPPSSPNGLGNVNHKIPAYFGNTRFKYIKNDGKKRYGNKKGK